MPDVRVTTEKNGVWTIPDQYSILVAAPCSLTTRWSVNGPTWHLWDIDWSDTTIILERQSLRVEFIE